MNKIKEFSLGTIEYRTPNIMEAMRLLSKIGVKPGTQQEQSELDLMANLLEHMEPFIVKIEAIKDEQVITEWAEAVTHIEFWAPLAEIGGELLNSFSGGKSPLKNP